MEPAAATFAKQLGRYKKAIDDDIDVYASHIRSSTSQNFGLHAAAVTGAYLDMLARGGKRIRGALVMAGYEMCGGKDKQMIVRAATAIEMIHAYILIIDDIQDRSKLRRGKPTVHEMLAEYHREQGLAGDAAHTGIALALNAALAGAHAAQILLGGLSVTEELRIKALGIVNLTMITTAHGQTTDIMNEINSDVSDTDVENALEWKTAHYTMLNPLCVGMVLAGASCEDTDAIRDYALSTGRAFQVTDDIIGVFGDDEQTGKSAKDDIREGKRTLLTSHAFKNAPDEDQQFLTSCLGKDDLSDSEFKECRRILVDCGALEYAKETAKSHVAKALESLDRNAVRWQPDTVSFLRSLSQGLLERAA
jgi:geranylgeranyl diphosphate synthase type I